MIIGLEFTMEEMKRFLTQKGKYRIETISVPHHHTEYHNRIVEEMREIEIAYPKDIPLKNFIGNKDYNQISKWSLREVFGRELKETLLNL